MRLLITLCTPYDDLYALRRRLEEGHRRRYSTDNLVSVPKSKCQVINNNDHDVGIDP